MITAERLAQIVESRVFTQGQLTRLFSEWVQHSGRVLEFKTQPGDGHWVTIAGHPVFIKYPGQPRDKKGKWTSDQLSSLDRRIIDFKPDRPLSPGPGVVAIESVVPNIRLVPYTKMPFFNQLNELIGVDPRTASIEKYAKAREKLFEGKKVQGIPIDRLVATQPFVNKAKIEDLVKKITEKPAMAVRYQGETYIIDGHHHAVAAVLRGEKSVRGHLIQTRVLNLDKKKYLDMFDLLEIEDDADDDAFLFYDPTQPRYPKGFLAAGDGGSIEATEGEGLDWEELSQEEQTYAIENPGGNWVTIAGRRIFIKDKGIPTPKHKEQDQEQKGLKAYIDVMAQAGKGSSLEETPGSLLQKHGRGFYFDQDTYKIKHGDQGLCYQNAGRLALYEGHKYTYVEGFVSVHGVPIQHAWVVEKATGKIKDPTIKDAEGIGGYFGIPFKEDYVRTVALRSKMWGVISVSSNLPLFKGKDKDYIAGDKDFSFDADTFDLPDSGSDGKEIGHEFLSHSMREYAKKEGCVWRMIGGHPVCITKGGSDRKVDPVRVANALRTYKAANGEVHATADAGEVYALSLLEKAGARNIRRIGGLESLDMTATIKDKKFLFEVKTLTTQENEKATMHPDSKLRKEKTAKSARAIKGTIIIDMRDNFHGGKYSKLYSGTRVWYYPTYASPRLGTKNISKIKSPEELARIVVERAGWEYGRGWKWGKGFSDEALGEEP